MALIGPNAAAPRIQGGGSTTVHPTADTPPLNALRAALPQAEVTFAPGSIEQEVVPLLLSTLTNPVTLEPGLRARFLASGRQLHVENRQSARLVWLGGPAPIGRADQLELATVFRPTIDGPLRLAVATAGTVRVYADDILRHEATTPLDGDAFGRGLLAPHPSTFILDAVAGQPIRLRVENDIAGHGNAIPNALGITIGLAPQATDQQRAVQEAVQAAATADVAVVVIGTSSAVESEGLDRPTLALPPGQDDLVAAVADANPRTIVVVNSGAPVLLPWRDKVAAILLTGFGGQECAAALTDILLGHVEPGGRLSTTWPINESDAPVAAVTPVDGEVRYAEGIHIGYRAWLRADAQPAWPFGHGLGYTTWNLPQAMTCSYGLM